MDETELSPALSEEVEFADETVESPPTETDAGEQTERDFNAEVSALLTAFPDVAGKSLPDEVLRECVAEGAPLVRVYAAYRERAARTAQQEQHRTDTAARAPVRAASVGAPTDYAPADPFLQGLNSY